MATPLIFPRNFFMYPISKSVDHSRIDYVQLAITILLIFIGLLLLYPSVTYADSKPIVQWVGSEPNFEVKINDINFKDIADFTQDDRVVTQSIAKLIKDGKAQVIPNKGSFNLLIQDVSTSESVEFAIHLKNGTELSVQVPVTPVSIEEAIDAGDVKPLNESGAKTELLNLPKSITPRFSRASSCGGYYDSANPYPCCSNGSAPDGNCTWYAWYRAHQTYRGWGMMIPVWGSPGKWASGAMKDSRFVVSNKPKRYSEGYSIGVNSKHAAWVWEYDDKYVWVDEQNCCPGVTTSCSYAGTHDGANAVKYLRSNFTYISRK